jgi:hypothetical protein
MCMVFNIKDIVDIVKILYESILDLRNRRKQNNRLIFDNVVQPSFEQLENIHDDYTNQLSQLRIHLQKKTLPPRDLLIWLRNAGLKYRMEREFLWTVDTEVSKPQDRSNGPKENHDTPFDEYLKKYVKSIIDYYRCTVSFNNLSFYRDFEYNLETLLNSLEVNNKDKSNSQELSVLFYDDDSIMHIVNELTLICDVRLSKMWQNVCICYRELRKICGYRSTNKGQD